MYPRTQILKKFFFLCILKNYNKVEGKNYLWIFKKIQKLKLEKNFYKKFNT